MSGTREGIARVLRTLTPNNPPAAGALLEGELSVEMAEPMKIWVGVPIGMDSTGRKLLFDKSTIPEGGPFLPLSGGNMLGPMNLWGDPTQPLHPVPLQYLQANYAPIVAGGYVKRTGDTMTGGLVIKPATGGASLKLDAPGPGWPSVTWNAQVAGIAAGYFQSTRFDKARWSVEFGGTEAETGGNAGTNFLINRFADDGTPIFPSPFGITRGTGNVNIGTRLMLALDPTAPLEAVTMRWVQNNYQSTTQGDGRWINVAGDAMTGALSLSGDPTAPLHAVPKQWIEANYSTNSQGDTRWVNVTGDTMSGSLIVTALTKVGRGAATAPLPSANTDLQIAGPTGGSSAVTLDAWAAGTQFIMRRTNGTVAAPLTIASGDALMSFRTAGYDGTAWTLEQIALSVFAEQAWTPTAQGRRTSLWTVPNGSTAHVERLRIDNSGIVMIGQTAVSGAAILQVNGGLSLTSGDVTLARDPSAPMHAVNKQWIETNYSTNSQGDSRWVNVAGDTMTGDLTVQGMGWFLSPWFTIGDGRQSGGANLYLDSGAGSDRNLFYQTAGVDRWRIGLTNQTEPGDNSGADLAIFRSRDDGTLINTPFSISRATGRANFVNGIRTNDNVVAGPGNDLSQHIDLYGGAYGFSVTGSTLNIVTGIQIALRVGPTQLAQFDMGGLRMSTGMDITLDRDPTQPMHAINKRWADAQLALYLPLTGGTLTGPVTFNANVIANSGINVNGGNLVVGWAGAGGAFSILNSGPGYSKGLAYQSNSLNRWNLVVDGTGELADGSNAGADWIVQRFNDAGGLMGAVLTFNRKTGLGTVLADPTAPMGIATKKYADDTITRFGGPFLPLSAGSGVPLSGMLYLMSLLPTLNEHATNKLYVDQRDAILQQQIMALAQNLIFVGQIDVTTDVGTYTVASGIPSPGPLPAAGDANRGYYVIVVVPGAAKQPSNIPPGDYVRSDWLVSNGLEWVWLKLGLVYFTASEVETLPAIEGTTNVQATLQWLADNKVDLDGDTLTGPLYLHADPTTDMMAADKRYVDGVITRAGGPFLPLVGGTLTGPLITTKITDQSGDIASGTVTNSTGAFLTFVAAPSVSRGLKWFSGGHVIWQLSTADAEFGGAADSGGNLAMFRYSDNGTFLSKAWQTHRDTGSVEFGNGIGFGGLIGGANWDLTRHISLHNAGYGLSVTPARLNIVTGGDTFFVNNNADVAAVGGGGLYMLGATDITLARDPSQPMHAVNKGWVEANYSSNAQGDLRWVNTTGDAMSGPLQINWTPNDTSAQLWLRPAPGNGGQSKIRFSGTFATGVPDQGQRYIASIRSGFSPVAWGDEYLDIWLTNQVNDGNSDLLQGRVARFTNTLTTLDKATRFNAGINFANNIAASPSDLSKHIDFYGGAIGFSVTGYRFNYVTNANTEHVFVVGGADVAKIGPAGLTMLGATDVTLARDPSQPMHAVTKQWVEAKTGLYLPLTGGNVTGPTGFTPYINVTGAGGHIVLQPGFQGGAYNPLVQTNDVAVFVHNDALNTGVLTLMPWSASALGIRIDGPAHTVTLAAANGVTVSDALSVVGVADFANLIRTTANVGGVVPPPGNAGYVMWNGSGSQGEMTFANGYTGTNTSFSFRQIKGPGVWDTHATLDNTGLTLQGLGVRYNGVAGGGNVIGFAWTGTAMNSFVDGTNVGTLAVKGDIPIAATYPPLMDGASSVGTNMWVYAQADHVHPTQLRAASILADTSRTLSVAEVGTQGLYLYGAPTAGPVTLTLPVATTPTTMWQVLNITGQTLILQGASGGTITLQPGANQGVWTDTGGIYPLNTTSVTPGPGSNDNSVATTGWVTSGFVKKTGDQMSGGLSFGQVAVSNPLDLSRHIALYDGWGGFSVIGGAMNIVAGSVVTLQISPGELGARVPLTLSRDPVIDMEAVTKRYVVGGFLPLTGGTITGRIVINDSGSWTPLAMATAPGAPCMITYTSGTDNSWWVGSWAGGALWIRDATAGVTAIICDPGGTKISVPAMAVGGVCTLALDPALPMEAATKQYVDGKIGGSGFLPLTGGILTGPLSMGVAAPAAAKARTIQTEMLVLPFANGGIGANVYVDNVGGGAWKALANGAGWMMINGATDTWQLSTWNTSTAGATVTGIGRLTFDGRGNLAMGYLAPQTAALGNSSQGGWLFGWGATLNNWAGNAFYDGVNWRYREAGVAWNVQGANGASMLWQASPSGAAGAVAPMITQMQLSFDGGLNVNLSIRTRQIFVINPPGGDSTINLDGIAGTYRYIAGLTNGKSRWQIQMPNAAGETGGNAGSDFIITRFDDAGNYLGNPLSIIRSNGNVTIAQNLSVLGAVTATNQYVISATGGYFYGDASFSQIAWDSGGWVLQYVRANGTLRYLRGGDSALMWQVDGSGNTHSGGSSTVTGRLTTNEIMCGSGIFRVANNDNYYMQRDGGGQWNWVEGGTLNMWLTANGDFRTRTSVNSPTLGSDGATYVGSTLYVNGGNMIFGPGGGGRIMQFQAAWYWNFETATGNLMWMNASFGPTWMIHTNGSCYNNYIWTGGRGPYQDVSDDRQKVDIRPAAYGLDAILALEPINFRRLRPKHGVMIEDEREDVGFSAQQVQRVMPEAVNIMGDDDDGMLCYGTTPIVAALVNSIKTLVEQNSALAARVTQLEQQRMH